MRAETLAPSPKDMGSSLTLGPFGGPFDTGAVLYWGPKQGPYFRELPIWLRKFGSGP